MAEKTRKRRSFSDEFKLEAAELANKIGNSNAARELGINESVIRNWKKSLEGNQAVQTATPSGKTSSDLEREVRRLEKENRYLKEINNILKKSTAIFSADHMERSK